MASWPTRVTHGRPAYGWRSSLAPRLCWDAAPCQEQDQLTLASLCPPSRHRASIHAWLVLGIRKSPSPLSILPPKPQPAKCRLGQSLGASYCGDFEIRNAYYIGSVRKPRLCRTVHLGEEVALTPLYAGSSLTFLSPPGQSASATVHLSNLPQRGRGKKKMWRNLTTPRVPSLAAPSWPSVLSAAPSASPVQRQTWLTRLFPRLWHCRVLHEQSPWPSSDIPPKACHQRGFCCLERSCTFGAELTRPAVVPCSYEYEATGF